MNCLEKKKGSTSLFHSSGVKLPGYLVCWIPVCRSCSGAMLLWGMQKVLQFSSSWRRFGKAESVVGSGSMSRYKGWGMWFGKERPRWALPCHITKSFHPHSTCTQGFSLPCDHTKRKNTVLKKPAGSPEKKMVAFVDCMVTLYSFITVWEGASTSAVQLPAAASLVACIMCVIWKACAGKRSTAGAEECSSLAPVHAELCLATWGSKCKHWFFSSTGLFLSTQWPCRGFSGGIKAEQVLFWEHLRSLSAGTAAWAIELRLNPGLSSHPLVWCLAGAALFPAEWCGLAGGWCWAVWLWLFCWMQLQLQVFKLKLNNIKVQ